MPIGGKLVLKGGVPLKGKVQKKQKKPKQPQEAAEDEAAAAGDDSSKQVAKVAATAINVQSGKSYEQEFELEVSRMAKPKVKTTPWGSSYREAPEILHGYNKKVTGVNASERLDMRAATKADKFCK
ncbi:hypothetical protein OEZ85_005619 [Tetradesmus obliquus]|uniref:Uncharacterized protein n=2 Tax=Tetradesmus obliquus TaxID=3088 RepID=A0A383VQK3_TETOB|nr:hypothetical protein OEZ85_005619 [Tetradesmus obliquus]|eukprot:jgi/Sobl393_1/16413/SZX67795.1